MRQLPPGAKRPATRRHYAQVIARVLGLAVYPLRLIKASPLPKGFLPKVGKPPAFSYLYPVEDAALMACKAVPVQERLLFGFLSREGMRVSEALSLRWQDIDLERGSVSLDRNKTDDARTWVLDPGVARALAVLHDRSKPAADALVFPSPRWRGVRGGQAGRGPSGSIVGGQGAPGGAAHGGREPGPPARARPPRHVRHPQPRGRQVRDVGG